MTYWRERVLDQVLLGTLVLGAIVYGPSVYMAVASGTLGVAFIDTVAFAGVIGLYFAKRLPHHVRAAVFLLIIYFLSTWLLVSVGPISQVYLLGFAIFAGLLIGFRAAIGAGAIGGATLLGVGYHMQANFPSRFLDEFGSLPAWSVITLNFVLVNSVICISIAILLRGLEASIGKEHASAAALPWAE